MNSFMDSYYRDEETNELIKDNINLNLKLGGYLQFRKKPDLKLELNKDVFDLKQAKTPLDLQMFFDFNKYGVEQSLLETSNNELQSYRNTSPVTKLFTPLTPVQLFSQKSPIRASNLLSPQFTRSFMTSTMNITPTNFNFDLDVFNISDADDNFLDTSDNMEFSSSSTPESKDDNDYFYAISDLASLHVPKLEDDIIDTMLEENYLLDNIPVNNTRDNVPSCSTSHSPAFNQGGTLKDLIVKRFHSKVNAPDFITCFHCGKNMDDVFAYIFHLDQEKLFHELKYKCPLNNCPFNMIGFNKKIQLRQHSLAKHYEKKTNSFICGDQYELALLQKLLFVCECNKAFCRRDSLQRHIKLLHSKRRPGRWKNKR